MKTKAAPPRQRQPSRRIREGYEGMRRLFNAGLIDKREMAKFDVLCAPKPPLYSPRRIRALRHKHNLSQAVLASALNTSLSTIRQWEIGQRHPAGPSQKLLYILETKGLEGLA
jgi:putative transcriptional regulator